MVSRVVNYVLSANDVTFSEELLIVGNQCLQELCRCLQNHFAASCPDLVNFVIQQFDEPELFSADHTLSVIKLLMQVCAGCLCNIMYGQGFCSKLVHMQDVHLIKS